MFESGIERTIIGTAVVLWFAHGWYLNERLKNVHLKLDLLLQSFDGLRRYLYEIDPQFDDERSINREAEMDDSMFLGIDEFKLIERKEAEGKRTLNTPFISQ